MARFIAVAIVASTVGCGEGGSVGGGPNLSIVTVRESIHTDGTQANASATAGLGIAISADGRFVAWTSTAANLVDGKTSSFQDVFLRDRQNQTTERVSLRSSGIQMKNDSSSPSISKDGRYVAFATKDAENANVDINTAYDVYLRDRVGGTTQLISVVPSTGMTHASELSTTPSISEDGSWVAFVSDAPLLPSDTNAVRDVYLRDRRNGATTLVSVNSAGTNGGNAASGGSIGLPPGLSSDGRYVVFQSDATDLQGGDASGTDIFVRDTVSGTTQRVSLTGGGADQSGGSSFSPALSADGRYVVFSSEATNLVAGDTNGLRDVFVRDRTLGTTERVSLSSSGSQTTDAGTLFVAAISADGRSVAFESASSQFVANDTNSTYDVFVRDRGAATTTRVSIHTEGTQGNDVSSTPRISADGRWVLFTSLASNLVARDTNGLEDVFVRGTIP